MYLIQDSMPLIFTLCEAESKDGIYKLRGLFHLAETKNANGRIYPKNLLEREMKKILPAIQDRRVLGEISHPDSPEINLEKSSHLVTNLKMDGNKMFGELETIKTPAGKILEGLINSGVKLGISSRGLGSLKENSEGEKIVQEDFNLVTWDVVPNPSTPDAWLAESIRPIYIPAQDQIVENELDIIEFGGENEKIQENSKITLELLIKNINEVFGGQ